MTSPIAQAFPQNFTHTSLPENPTLLCSFCSKCGKLIAASTHNDNLEIAERTHHCDPSR